MLSRISGMVRDMAMAASFGAHPAVAAFFLAFRFANLPRRLLGEGAMHSALVPYFERLRAQNPLRAAHFFRSVALSLTVLLVFLVLASEGVLYFFEGEAIKLTMVMLPALLFICLYGINSSILNCEGSYFVPSVAPVAFNGVWIVAVICLNGLPAAEAMPKLAGAVVGACALQWLVTLPGVWKFFVAEGWHLQGGDLKALLRPLGLGMLGIGASQLNSALDPTFARFADPSGPAYLWFAIRIQQLPLALFGISLSGALLPPLSRAVASGNWEEYGELLRYCRLKSLKFLVPCTLGIFLFGRWGVDFLFEHGKFSVADAVTTTHCLWAYGLGLIPMGLVLIEANTFFAKNDTRTPAIVSSAAVGLNLALNALFVFGFGWGTVSVAIATSIASWGQLSWYVLTSCKSRRR
ncbi:MAG: murein biosynthesis integral membrane protein MurJ [Verrucomicrobia bacterium]|nr:murein biosynthesis integral membrane protein MurJ [Verrucomicrobiota bacterium]